jgi:hypothetical protein
MDMDMEGMGSDMDEDAEASAEKKAVANAENDVELAAETWSFHSRHRKQGFRQHNHNT